MPYEPLRLAPFDPNLDAIALTSYTYTNQDDDLATIKTPGYFDKDLESSDNFASVIKINDVITIQGAGSQDIETSEQVRVTAVTPLITVTPVVPAPIPPAFTIIDSFTAITLGGSPSESFTAPNTLPGDNVIATAGLTVTVAPLVAQLAGVASVGIITVVFNVDPSAGSEVHILSVR